MSWSSIQAQGKSTQGPIQKCNVGGGETLSTKKVSTGRKTKIQFSCVLDRTATPILILCYCSKGKGVHLSTPDVNEPKKGGGAEHYHWGGTINAQDGMSGIIHFVDERVPRWGDSEILSAGETSVYKFRQKKRRVGNRLTNVKCSG